MSSFHEKISSALSNGSSRLCAGVDPPLHLDSEFLEKELATTKPRAFLESYSRAIIDGSSSVTKFCKFQSAFFEARGNDGVAALETSICYAHSKNMFIVLDAKRGDISSTMEAYGHWAFDQLKVDALTVSPWMGTDVFYALAQWLKKDHGVFIVWFGSNTSSEEQFPREATAQSETLNSHLFIWHQAFEKIGAPEAIGAVVGSNRVKNVKNALWNYRGRIPILMPGVGAQGGEINELIRKFLAQNPNTIINVSRGLTISESNSTASIRSWAEFAAVIQKNAQIFAREFN